MLKETILTYTIQVKNPTEQDRKLFSEWFQKIIDHCKKEGNYNKLQHSKKTITTVEDED